MYPTGAGVEQSSISNSRNPIYEYRSNYKTNSNSFSRFSKQDTDRPRDLYESNYDGYRYINRAGGGTYRPRRFMDPEKANFMNSANSPPELPKHELKFRPASQDKLGRPWTENTYAKWEEHPLYQTTNRMAVAQPKDRVKYHYHGIKGEFTQSFCGHTFRNFGLSTAMEGNLAQEAGRQRQRVSGYQTNVLDTCQMPTMNPRHMSS